MQDHGCLSLCPSVLYSFCGLPTHPLSVVTASHLFCFSSHPHLLHCIHSQLLTLFPISLRKHKHSKETSCTSSLPCTSTKPSGLQPQPFSCHCQPPHLSTTASPSHLLTRGSPAASLLHYSASHFLHPCKYVNTCSLSDKYQKALPL